MENNNKKGYILDLDGTLYKQKPVRLSMFGKLLKYYLLHISKWRQLYGLSLFRRLREKQSSQGMLLDEQIEYASAKAGIDKTELDKCIRYWMFEYPLFLIDKYKNEELLAFIQTEQEMGKIIIVYSDYPVEQKLECLNVKPDYIFYPGLNGVKEMKPSYTTMEHILKTVNLNPEDILYIGDRMDRDGESAKLLNISFMLVHK